MPDIDLTKLRETAQKVVERKQEEAKLEAERKQAEFQAKVDAAKAKAASIITGIPSKLAAAAADGKFAAKVMELDYSELNYLQESLGMTKRSSYSSRDQHSFLTAQLVWQYCVEQGLKPTIEDEHDGVGIRSWYYITARF